MSTQNIYNFGPGPATLPPEVIAETSEALTNFHGLPLMETSHRSAAFGELLDETTNLVIDLLEVPHSFRVLFLQGGASLQFAMIPLNLLKQAAAYIVTGYWSQKAAAEARQVGEIQIPFDGVAEKFATLPDLQKLQIDPTCDYAHITANNTIYGTQFSTFPDTGNVPLIADMSSDLLSRPVDLSQFGMVYACAQKNLGPSGITLVLIREDLVTPAARQLPTFLTYAPHADKGSLYHTPPIATIFTTNRVLHWIKRQGGATAMQQRSEERARLLYDIIDKFDCYQGTATPGSRSLMNVTFTLPDAEQTTRFIQEAEKVGLKALKGHRALGGVRASIYNGMPVEGTQRLAEFMQAFARNL